MFGQRIGNLRWHVFLIMLGKHGIGDKLAVVIQSTVSDDALPLAKQVGQDAAIDDRELLFEISQGEFDVEFAGLLNDASLDNDATDPKIAIARHISLNHFRYLDVEHHVLFE